MALLSQRGDKVTTRPDGSTDAVIGRAQVDERVAARRRLEARKTVTGADTVVMTPDDTAVIGRRTRTSMLATLSLVSGVVAALAVLTGLLAGPGVAVGLLAVILGIGGISATGRPHVAGKGDALLGIALGLGGVVVGVLALTGLLPWMDADVNMVDRARDWLDSHLPWLFPNS